MHLILKTTLIGTLLLSTPLTAFALESDRRQPISIEADQASLDQKNQSTTFSGNVAVKQGSLSIRASHVRVSQDKQGNQTMYAEGSPVQFGQKLDNAAYVEGQSRQVEYSSSSGMVKLTGNAQVRRGNDIAKGEVITYNTRTEIYTVVGGKSTNGNARRVHIVIHPTEK